MDKLTYLGNKKPTGYYQAELNKINQLSLINIKITDSDGNETKFLGVNKESLNEINGFLVGCELLLPDK